MEKKQTEEKREEVVVERLIEATKRKIKRIEKKGGKRMDRRKR